MSDFFINGLNNEQFSCALLDGWSVGASELSNSIQQGRNRTSYRLLASVFGRKPIAFTLVFSGASRNAVSLAISQFATQLYGKFELQWADGFEYSCTLDSIGNPVWYGFTGLVLAQVEYSLHGIQHGPMKTITVPVGGTLICESTMPKTDCIVEATAGTAGTYQLAGATFSSVQVGNVLTVDGINCRFLLNGAPTTATFSSFPQLVPGANVFSAPDPVTVSYYPSYL